MIGPRAFFLSVLTAFSALACAQGSFDDQVADIGILQAKPVQKEIGITEAQRARMNVAAGTHNDELKAYDQELQRTHSKPDQKRVIGYFLEMRSKVIADLSPGQLKRLRELTLQANGPFSLADSAVAKRVGLSSAQLKRIRGSIDASEKALASMEQTAAKPIIDRFKNIKPTTQQQNEEMLKKFRSEMRQAGEKLGPRRSAMRREAYASVLAVLTPAQKTTWKSLLGRPFAMQ